MAEWVVNWAWFLMIVCWKESCLVGEEWCRLLLSSYVVEEWCTYVVVVVCSTP